MDKDSSLGSVTILQFSLMSFEERRPSRRRSDDVSMLARLWSLKNFKQIIQVIDYSCGQSVAAIFLLLIVQTPK